MIAPRPGTRTLCAVPVARAAPRSVVTPSSPCTRPPGSAWSSRGSHAGPAAAGSMRVPLGASCTRVDRKAILDNIMEGSAGRRWARSRPACPATGDMQLDRTYPSDRATCQGLAGTRRAGRLDPTASMQKGGQRLSLSWSHRARGRSSQGRRDHRGHPGHVLAKSGSEGQVQVLEWAAVFQQVRGQPAQPPHVHCWAG